MRPTIAVMRQNVITDDSEFVEQALKEYRQATEDYANFADLHREAQHVILQHAQQLKDSTREFERLYDLRR